MYENRVLIIVIDECPSLLVTKSNSKFDRWGSLAMFDWTDSSRYQSLPYSLSCLIIFLWEDKSECQIGWNYVGLMWVC